MNAKLGEWTVTVTTFIGAIYFYLIIAYYGVEEYFLEGPMKDYLNSNVVHLEVFISGIFLGILFVLIKQLTEKRFFRRKSFGFNILFKSGLYLLAIIAVGVLVYYLFLYSGLVSAVQMEAYQELLSSQFLLSILVYFGFIILLMNFMIFVNRKLGPGTLLDVLTGKYHHPRNEELIFLFLDLKGSTSLAEKLGHSIYSRFLKECIHELTPVIQKYKAKVYQYVGDEVVLFWEKKEGLNQLNCIGTFFEFNDILKTRENYFSAKYGQTPEFKAGMDTGIVTATEIGDIKRDIAFHGDVLNTASRLEKKCNEFNEKLIVSQHLTDQILSDDKYQLKFLSDLPLTGKTENVKFYGVENN